LFITSYASLRPEGDSGTLPTGIEGLELKVRASDKPKCVRCWHHREDVGKHPDHPELCGRCVENVAGQGETRLYA
jgi:isoleucyl-tRNA synthetase